MQEKKTLIITKKRLILGLLLLTVVFLSWIAFRYTWLTVNLTSGDVQVTVMQQSTGDVIRETTTTGQSTTMFLRRDNYNIEIASGNKQSIYTRSLGVLTDTLDTKLHPQLTSQYIGINDYPCIHNRDGEFFFSSCSPSARGSFISSSERGFIGSSLPGMRSETSQEVFGGESILKPYQNGFLAAWKDSGNLLLIPREIPEDDNIITIDEFGGSITADTFDTSLDSNHIAIYDDRENNLVIIGGLDEEPTIISLDEYNFPGQYAKKVVVSGESVYLFSYTQDLHPQHNEYTGQDDQVENNDQKILVFNADEKELRETITIPEQQLLMNITPGYDNRVFIGSITDDGWRNTLIQDAKKTDYNNLAVNPQSICWIDKDGFYYMSDSADTIYRHSLSEKASFLVYSGLTSRRINSLHCDNDDLYFDFDYTSQRITESDRYYGYHHYKLIEGDFTGQRTEGLTPFFVLVGGEGGDIVQVDQSLDGLLIEEHLFVDTNSPPDKDTTRQAVVQELEEKSVNTDGINLVFGF